MYFQLYITKNNSMYTVLMMSKIGLLLCYFKILKFTLDVSIHNREDSDACFVMV